MARLNRRRLIAEINVVPYIDVMLVLLVIFMVTAPLLQQGVEVDLPVARSKTLSKTEKPPVIISINKNGMSYVNQGGEPDKPLDTKAMLVRLAALKRQNPELKVFIKGDRAVEYGQIVQVMSLLQELGIEGVGLLTDSIESQKA